MTDSKKPDLQDKPLSKKSYGDIIKEGQKRVADGKPIDDVPQEKPVEEAPKEEKENKVEKKAQETRDDKAIEEKAAAAARVETDRVIKEREETKEREAKEAAKKEELEKRKTPPWKQDATRPKDKDGNPLPKSYDEIYESAKEAAKAEVFEELERRDAEHKAATEAETQKTEAQKAQDAEFMRREEQRITSEVESLREIGKLPKVKDPNNKEDEGVKAMDALFQVATTINNERISKGLAPITSITDVRILDRYKAPVSQPAGADAPVAGATAPPDSSGTEFKYADVKKSWRQILSEGARRVSGGAK